MNDIQVMDIIESLKSQIADLSYQLALKDGTIKVLEKKIKELEKEIETAGIREPVVQ